jgi:predicted ArsR family transcriptional regulator
MLRSQVVDTTRGRIVTLLQRGGLTADDIATALGLTANGVRAHMIAMERDGIVRGAGRRRGLTRPSRLFELTPEVEQLISRAYIPVLTQLVRVLATRLPPAQLESLLRQAGTALADELLMGKRPAGTLDARVRAASTFINEQLGGLTRIERNGRYRIVAAGCPLAALTGNHRAVCLAMEQLVTRVAGARAHECCDRSNRPRCCFEIERQRPSQPRKLRVRRLPTRKP